MGRCPAGRFHLQFEKQTPYKEASSPSCHTRSILATREATWSAVPQEHVQRLFESMPRRVAAVISNNGGYSGY
ncbi:hypothetical protein TNCV_5076511 [Trichonephila clavipes]|uniref:Uncharacterized protein n=1 Tax=Trichonephila clavipes TaxID=2585209 RepID=A0A8X6RU98_TRICX|nr:hypothetical protein TNCV_5076511 [Trichonephila clavipes]